MHYKKMKSIRKREPVV